MRRGWQNILVAAALALGVGACAHAKADHEPINSTAELVTYLDKNGIPAYFSGKTNQTNLSQAASEYQVRGGMLRIFEYKSPAAAIQDYGRIDNEVKSRTPMVFYDGGKLIVIYWGNDPLVEEKLTDVMGPSAV